MELPLALPGIYTLRGPRQVGKTTTLKLMLRNSLADTSGEEVLYYSCDLDNDPDTIRAVVEAAKAYRPKATRWRIFLDEVTSIPHWERGVKWLRDNTEARRDTFVVTGSSAVDIAAGADRLPGRRGKVERPDRILMPLSFADFARIHGSAPPLSARPTDFLKPELQEQLRPASLQLTTLQILFERYLRTGGFPAAVIDEHMRGAVSDTTLGQLWGLVESEIQRQRLDPVRAYRAIEHVVRALGSMTDWTGLGETLDADRRTAEDYARVLALTFVVLILYKWDPRRGGPQLRAQRKVYFVDPLFAMLPQRLRRSDAGPEVSALVENAVILGLFRSEEQPLAEEFALPQGLYYWKSRSGGEVNALVGTKDRTPVEVKYREELDQRHVAALTRSFPRGVVVTKSMIDLQNRDYPRVPAALFLWLLSGETTISSAA